MKLRRTIQLKGSLANYEGAARLQMVFPLMEARSQARSLLAHHVVPPEAGFRVLLAYVSWRFRASERTIRDDKRAAEAHLPFSRISSHFSGWVALEHKEKYGGASEAFRSPRAFSRGIFSQFLKAFDGFSCFFAVF